MYGLIAKLTIHPGKRDEMTGILKESAANMPGCMNYFIAEDATDESVFWVTEVWASRASHDASFSLPQVKRALPLAKALVARFEKVAETLPLFEWACLTRPPIQK